MKSIPQIQKYMSTDPFTINSDQTLAQASKIMSEHRIRHLPVLHAGKIVGLLSERDVSLICSIANISPEDVCVSEAMATDPYIVKPEALLDEVVLEMAEKKYGSAVVMHNHKVVGIFTAVDGLRTLSELLQTRLAK